MTSETDRVRKKIYEQKKYFSNAVKKKKGLLSEEELEDRLLEKEKERQEMEGNIGGG